MAQQNYSNHRKIYPLHHFIFLPMMLAFTILGFVKFAGKDENHISWLLFGISSFCTLFLAVMMRQHYALGNQNRIVRLEFRLRYFELFGESAKDVEQQLSFKQIAALRFAPDEEFKTLLHKTITDNLSADDIKKSIRNWQADDMRV